MPLLHSSKYYLHIVSFALHCGEKVGLCLAVGEYVGAKGVQPMVAMEKGEH